jgi:hypothetical protein
VQGDYAHMVNNMLGTEQVVGSRKTVVTPSTWWAGGYPAVEKVTYLMSVPGTSMSGGKELRSPEHSGLVPPFRSLTQTHTHTQAQILTNTLFP